MMSFPHTPMLDPDTIIDMRCTFRRAGYYMVRSIIGSQYELIHCTKRGNRFFKFLLQEDCLSLDIKILKEDNGVRVMEEETKEYRLNKKLRFL